MKRRFLIGIAAVCVVAGSAPADIIRVPTDFPTIQAAINASADGDTVAIAPGVYTGAGNRDLDTLGKAITVSADGPPGTVTIDCDGADGDEHRGFRFHSAEPRATKVVGLNIINGYGGGGPGMLFEGAASPTIIDCTIEACSTGLSGGTGGAINIASASPRFLRCDFRLNFARTAGGGADISGISSPEFSGCNFFRNDAEFVGGGARITGGTARFEQCSFDGNESDTTGGIAISGAAVTFDRCLITDNLDSVNVGGIEVGPTASATFIDTDIVANLTSFASEAGGLLVRGTATMVNCRVTDNESAIAGGGITVRGTLHATNCIIARNYADIWGGGINAGGTVELANCSILFNEIDEFGESGGGINVASTHVAIHNCIVRGNSFDQIGGDESPLVSYSNVEGGWPGTGNIDANPLFISAPLGNYHLGPGSPCIDAANNAELPQDSLDLDADGNTAELIPFDADRTLRRREDPFTADTGSGTAPLVDMGAFEFQPPAETAVLTGFTVTTGSVIGGGLADLVASDNSFLHLRSGFGRTFADLHKVELEVDAVTGVNGPRTLDIVVESFIDQPVGVARYALRNASNGDLETVGQGVVGLTEQVAAIHDIAAPRYVGPSGEIAAQVRHIVFVPFFAFLFDSLFDEVRIDVR